MEPVLSIPKIRHIYKRDGEILSVNEEITSGVVLLSRYVPNSHNGAVVYDSFWTQVYTDYPKIAGEAVGISYTMCFWRINAVFSSQEFNLWFIAGEKRFSNVGVAREYQNIIDIPSDRLSWTKLECKATEPNWFDRSNAR